MAAAEAADLHYSTVWTHRNDDPDFAEEEQLAMARADDTVVSALFQAAKDGNVTAIQVWLYNRRPEEWRDKRGQPVMISQQTQVSNNGVTDALAAIDDLDEAGKEAYLALAESARRAIAGRDGDSERRALPPGDSSMDDRPGTSTAEGDAGS